MLLHVIAFRSSTHMFSFYRMYSDLQLPACSNVVKYGMLVSKLVAIQSITGANLTLRYMMKHVNDADQINCIARYNNGLKMI